MTHLFFIKRKRQRIKAGYVPAGSSWCNKRFASNGVWDAGKSYTRLGRWWSLSKPVGPKENYQHDNAICPAWSALNRLVSCDVKVGSSIVIGTTQSAACDDSIYAKTAANQVFIPNDTRNDQLWVENCRDEGTWPNQ